MQLIKWTDPKKLLPLTLLVTPVAGEMMINANGLPTPWPIAVVSVFLTYLSFIKFRYGNVLNRTLNRHNNGFEGNFGVRIRQQRNSTEETNLGLNAPIFILNLMRCLVALFGSWNSLRVHGISGFQYPELVGSLPIAMVVTMHLVIELEESEIFLSKRETLFFWISGVISTFLSALWTIVALGVYASLKNFSVGAQFLTNCTEMPNPSSYTIVQCSPSENGFSCYLGSKNAWIIDIFTRVLLLFTFFLVGPYYYYSNDSRTNKLISVKKIKYYGAIFTLSASLIFMVAIASIQSQGLNTQGLAGICDINPSLLSSKTGYITEWFFQKLTAFKQIALI